MRVGMRVYVCKGKNRENRTKKTEVRRLVATGWNLKNVPVRMKESSLMAGIAQPSFSTAFNFSGRSVGDGDL